MSPTSPAGPAADEEDEEFYDDASVPVQQPLPPVIAPASAMLNRPLPRRPPSDDEEEEDQDWDGTLDV